ncbi:MAG TPA: ATP-binding cassette domain-containing protein, partial [Bacillota bacterium]|nr:ATP-binding cassette domain-containing protein [Bacillota bacterium]
LGPNGAGKSTTIKMMTGILEPTSGKVIVNGRIPYKNRTKNAQNIGVVFGQRTQLWWALPVIESFNILKEIYCVPDDLYKKNMAMFNDLVGVGDLYSKTVRQMSLGQRTLCDILAAFLHDPSVVFMDEPTIGLDVSMKSKIRYLVSELNKEKGTTIVLTTHDMGDVEALAKRIVIIDHGKMIYDDDINHLKSFFGAYRTIMITPDGEDVSDELAKECQTGIRDIIPEAKNVHVTVDEHSLAILVPEDEVSFVEVLQVAQEFRPLKDIQIKEISTETIIRKIYEGEAKDKNETVATPAATNGNESEA